MHEREPHLLNAGLYTVPEAARLTRISVGKVRRWLKGYDFRSGTSLRHSDAVWQGEIKPIENKLALSFRDLVKSPTLPSTEPVHVVRSRDLR